MSKQWYYADRQGQQQGPVETLWLQQAIKQRDLDPTALVWREGMDGWQPAYCMAAELGLGLGVQPPPLSQAQTATPRRVVQPSSSSSAWLVVILLLVGGIFVLGVLAAIAVPAYSDYTARAHTAAALAQGAALRHAVEAHIAEQQRCPRNGEGEIMPANAYRDAVIESILVDELTTHPQACLIQVRLHSQTNAGERHYLNWLRDADGDWQQSTNLPQRQLPRALREQLER